MLSKKKKKKNTKRTKNPNGSDLQSREQPKIEANSLLKVETVLTKRYRRRHHGEGKCDRRRCHHIDLQRETCQREKHEDTTEQSTMRGSTPERALWQWLERGRADRSSDLFLKQPLPTLRSSTLPSSKWGLTRHGAGGSNKLHRVEHYHHLYTGKETD